MKLAGPNSLSFGLRIGKDNTELLRQVNEIGFVDVSGKVTKYCLTLMPPVSQFAEYNSKVISPEFLISESKS